MEIKKAEFVTSLADISKRVDYGVPEIAVAGRSNVGKSTFINYLANVNRLAKASSTPGRTRLVNYFSVNGGEFMLVDLPGYGFTKNKGGEKDGWDTLIGGYLTQSKRLAAVAVLVDIRHEPTALDRQMIAFLHHYSVPFFVVATKADKLSRAAGERAKGVVAQALSLGKADVLSVSALNKSGKEEVLGKIENLLNS